MTLMELMNSLIQHHSDPSNKNKSFSNTYIHHMLLAFQKYVNQDYTLSAFNLEHEQMDIGDIPVKLKGEEEFYIVQPLIPLTYEEMEGLWESLKALGETEVFQGKQVIIIPYDVKMLRAKINISKKE